MSEKLKPYLLPVLISLLALISAALYHVYGIGTPPGSPQPTPSITPSGVPSTSPTPTPSVTSVVPVAPTLVSPPIRSTLPGASQTFQFAAGPGVVSFDVAIGSSQATANYLWATGLPCCAITPITLPTNGSTVWVRIFANYPGGKQLASDFTFTAASTAAPSPVPSSTPTTPPSTRPGSNLSAVWVNTGEDKVAQEETRATSGQAVKNSAWDGTKVSLFGAKNEVVAFNLVLEAGVKAAPGVTVSFSKLSGPNGALIQSAPVTGNGVFNYVGRNIELFLVRYLPIKGLSRLGYINYYDERHVPKRLRRPWQGRGEALPNTGWKDRPDHDRSYPDIAQPLELKPTFTVEAGKSQSIWADIFIPKGSPAGLYTGTLQVSESGVATYSIPVELRVRNFALPDVPTSKTMLVYGDPDTSERYLGKRWPEDSDPEAKKVAALRVVHNLVAHRHKISLIGDDQAKSGDAPSAAWLPVISGALFTAANGYDGPGVNTGNNVYSVGTYGSWHTAWGTTQASLQKHATAWENWFVKNAPTTERFLYVIDESEDYVQTEQWAAWVKAVTKLPTMATANLRKSSGKVPSLTYITEAAGLQPTAAYDDLLKAYRTDPAKKLFLYNGQRPAVGSFMTDDDGVALRVTAWAQYKKGVDRWLYWDSNYYNDYQGSRGQIDVWMKAQTFGFAPAMDVSQGETSGTYANGDGVLFYPGTDKAFPASNLGLDGPVASLRLKFWRRGIQDVDYLALARAINPVATQAIIDKTVPKVLWEVGVDDPKDPSYVHTDISWSVNPDDWEASRKALADIIDPSK